jgi:hypothetical protein
MGKACGSALRYPGEPPKNTDHRHWVQHGEAERSIPIICDLVEGSNATPIEVANRFQNDLPPQVAVESTVKCTAPEDNGNENILFCKNLKLWHCVR